MSIRAIALIGHSNAGKTPLGETIRKRAGTGTRRFHHLDFGEHLRRIAAGTVDAGLSADDSALVRSILDGRLLDDRHFPVAAAIIDRFLERHRFDTTADLLVLNGIPRHHGQARDLADHGIDVVLLIYCACSPLAALSRKRLAEIGRGHEDRSHRHDHDNQTFQRKIRSFERDTRPLLDHYRARGVEQVTIDVTAETTPDDAYEFIASRLHRL
jgi:adenylate kinase family enzyme